MGGLGIALGIFGAFWGAHSTLRTASDQAAGFYGQADIAEERGRIQAVDVLEEGQQVAGEIVAETAASGFELSGSPYIAMMDSLRKAEEDAEQIKQFAAEEAQYLRQTGRATREAGERQAIGQLLGGGGQAFSGVQGMGNVRNAGGY